jgi:hypothetical protein
MKTTELKTNTVYQREADVNPFVPTKYACVLEIKPNKYGDLWIRYCPATLTARYNTFSKFEILDRDQETISAEDFVRLYPTQIAQTPALPKTTI